MPSTSHHAPLKKGTIYVVRSQSRHPDIASRREELHKIGRTTTSTRTRLASARKDPTYLFAPVELVRDYEVTGGNPAAAEKLLHDFFKAARWSITVPAYGPYPTRQVKEWFLVPLPVLDEAIALINEGTIGQYWYDRNSRTIRKRTDPETH